MTPLHPTEAGGFSPRLRSALAPPGPPLAPVEPHPAQIALAFLARLRGAGEALFAAAVLAVVLLLVAPLPAGALDALLAVNLAGSATILVVTLFARSALGFASFPTLLLLTTLFRLALNVSSTRLVLSRGDAGRVIEAFGRVVVQGSPVVGAVVFAILALVQLLVVAKGAGLAAWRIRAAARRAGVPVVRDVPLARALHRLADVGDEIPQELYDAAAALLVHLYAAPEAR